jgi:CspA family cold shock protein
MSFSLSPTWTEGFQTEAIVKWFNLTKGFGFVAPIDGSSDAFIHSSVIGRAGLREVAEGTKMVVRVGDGIKGRSVLDIVEVLGIDEEALSSDTRRTASGPKIDMTGTVKWFNPGKGFGFVVPDQESRDIFLHHSVVTRSGLQTLEPGQKVKMVVQATAKGYEALSVALAESGSSS